MKATRSLPEQASFYHSLNLASRKMMVAQNVAGIVLFFFFGWIFMGVAAAINPHFFILSIRIFVGTLTVFWFLLTAVSIIIIHEIIHAIGFYWFTRERPEIGFHILYAYASAPNWYFTRNQFILIGILPFMLITSVGLMLMPFVNLITLPRLILALTLNAAGSIGDIIVVLWLVSQPSKAWIRDKGSFIALYHESTANNKNE